MPNAHHTMSNAEIVSHLVHKARPMHGANGLKEQAAASGDALGADVTLTDPGSTSKAPPSKQTKRKTTTLSKQIDKKNRKNRLGHVAPASR